MAEKRLRYAFIGDPDSLLRAISKSDTALGKFSRGLGKVGSAAATGFGIVGAAATVAGVQAIKTASNAAEAATAFDVTFGNAVKNLNPFIDEFANKAGLADFELKDLLKTTGAITQGIGFTQEESAELSKQISILAGDVAAFNNVQGGAQPVIESFTKALLGERESLKTYGVTILEADVQARAFLQTGKSNAKQLTQQEKALATLSLIQEKSAVAQGYLNDESESFAGRLNTLQGEIKQVQAELGEELLPIATDLLPVVGDLVKEFAEGFAPIMKEVAPIIQRVVDLFQVLAPVLLPMLENGFKALAKVFDIIVSVIEFMVGSFQDTNSEMDAGVAIAAKYGVKVEGVAGSYSLVTDASKEYVDQEKLKNINQQRSADMAEHYAKIYKAQFTPAVIDARNEIEKEDDMLKEMIATTQEASRVAREEAEAIQKDLIPNLSALQSARSTITAILDREKSATRALQQAKEDLVDINKSLLDIDETIAMANDDLATANQDVKDKEDALAKAKEKAKEVTAEERLAILRQVEAIERLTDEQDGSEIKTLELQLAQQRLNELRDEAVGSDRNVEEAERDLADAQREAENVAKRINDLLERKEELRQKEIEATEKVKEKQEDLNDVSTKNIDVMLRLAEAQEKYNEALEKLTDGKYEMALDKITKLAGEAITTASGVGLGTVSTAETLTETVPKVVKEVAAVATTVTGDPTRGAERAKAMGGLSTFGEPSVTVNFNGAVTNPQDAKNVVVQGLKEFNRTDGNLNRIINIS